MTARKQFILALVAMQVLAAVLMAIVAGGFLSATLEQIIAASNNPILAVMHDRVMMKTVISFTVIALIVMIVTIPAGILLSRLMVAPYLRVIKRFSTLARHRISGDDLGGLGKNERQVLEQYASVLLADMQTLRDYEKARSWKEGARMLMHELKNPLTPLKLSALQLALSSHGPGPHGEASTILASLHDIESILAMFKNLVNIEFGAKEIVDVTPVIDELLRRLQCDGLHFSIVSSVSGPMISSYYEPTLVKMLLVNLINNSFEENPAGCEIRLSNRDGALVIDILTPDRTVAEPALVFKAGYSRKGSGRGFGLFLAKLISDYLNLGISCANTPSGAIFSVQFKSVAHHIPTGNSA